jgi:3',5'-nucleoside bisphosphate phosphatase
MFSYINVDLHLHTVLSPCAEVEMIPPLIMARAKKLGLGAIAVTDHNSAENVAGMLVAGAAAGVSILPGMEVETKEEVHLICLFDTLEQDLAWQERVYAHLPDLKNNADKFGAQFVVDAEGEFVRENERLLLTPTRWSVEEVAVEVRALGGLCIPAHVDRPSYSLIANLGFVPPDVSFDALEVSRLVTPDVARQRFPQIAGYTLVIDGDAHRLSEVLCRTMVKVQELTIAELRLALRGQDDRRVIL